MTASLSECVLIENAVPGHHSERAHILTLINSTVSGNRYDGSSGGIGSGLYNTGTAEISYSTIAQNGDEEIWNDGGTVDVAASIISDPAADAPNCSGSITSEGYNLSSDASCNLSRTTDLVNLDPNSVP